MDFELLKSIGSKIMDVAPSLAGAILSPNPLTVMSAFSAIKKAVGLSDSAKENEVVDALAGMTPEQRLPLVKAEYDFKVAMKQEDTKAFLAELADIQSARNMNTDTTKATGKRDTNLYALAWVMVIGFFFLVGGLVVCSYYGKPMEDKSGVLFMLFGSLSTGFGTVLTFFFGSSKSSRDKDDVIANSTPLAPCK